MSFLIHLNQNRNKSINFNKNINMKFYKSRELRGALFHVDRHTDRQT